MKCKYCKSENVRVDFISTGSKTKVRHRGIIYGIFRFTMICFTCGLWCFVPRSKEIGNTKNKNRKMCICQNCGKSYYI